VGQATDTGRANYAENGAASDAGVYPVFVTVLKAHLPEPAALPGEVAALTQAIAAACARSLENVHNSVPSPGEGRRGFRRQAGACAGGLNSCAWRYRGGAANGDSLFSVIVPIMKSVRRFLLEARNHAMMKYKGYSAQVEFDDDAGIFHGEVINLRDVITFEGESVRELRQAF